MKKLLNLVLFAASVIAIVWLGIANVRKTREIESLEAIKRQYEMVYLPSIGVKPSDILISQPTATPIPSGTSKENCSTCEELECKLEDANNTIQVLEYSLNSANNRIEELEAELEDSYVNHEEEENIQDNSEEIENLEVELEIAKAELAIAEERIQELEEELSEAEEEITKLENKIEKLSSSNNDDSSEVKNLKKDLKDAQAEIKELEEDLAALKKENKTLKSDNDSLKKENKALNTEKEEFRSYWNDAEIRASEFSTELTSLKERNSEVEKLLNEASSRIADLERQIKNWEQWNGNTFDEDTYMSIKFPEDGHYYMTANKVTFYYDPTCTQKIDFDYWNHCFRSSKIDYDYAENGLSVYVLRMDNGMLVYCPQSKDMPYLVTVDEFWERIDEWEWLLNEY